MISDSILVEEATNSNALRLEESQMQSWHNPSDDSTQPISLRLDAEHRFALLHLKFEATAATYANNCECLKFCVTQFVQQFAHFNQKHIAQP